MARKGKSLTQHLSSGAGTSGSFAKPFPGPSAGDRIKQGGQRIAEDDPRWNWRSMGNRRRGKR